MEGILGLCLFYRAHADAWNTFEYLGTNSVDIAMEQVLGTFM